MNIMDLEYVNGWLSLDELKVIQENILGADTVESSNFSAFILNNAQTYYDELGFQRPRAEFTFEYDGISYKFEDDGDMKISFDDLISVKGEHIETEDIFDTIYHES